MDRWIDKYQRRVAWGEFCFRMTEVLAVFCLVLGVSILSVRIFAPSWWPQILWSLLLLLPASLFASWWAGRRQFSKGEAAARLDESLGLGGLLMTLSEQSDPHWEKHLPKIEAAWVEALPRFRPTRSLSVLTVPLVFAIAACLIPIQEVTAETTVVNEVATREFDKLTEVLAKLEEKKVVDPEELAEEIDELRKETQNKPLTSAKWEAVDAIRERMRAKIDERAARISQFNKSSSALSQTGDGDANPLQIEQAESLQKELQEALEKLANEGAFKNAPPRINNALESLKKDGKFKLDQNSKQREEVLKELSDFLDKQCEELKEARDKVCEGGNCPKGSEPGEKGNGESMQRRPGIGKDGVTEGPGSGFHFGEESETQKNKFRDLVLPAGTLDEPNQEVLGQELRAPTDTPGEASESGPARNSRSATGDGAWKRKLSLKHREVVKKYFSK